MLVNVNTRGLTMIYQVEKAHQIGNRFVWRAEVSSSFDTLANAKAQARIYAASGGAFRVIRQGSNGPTLFNTAAQ